MPTDGQTWSDELGADLAELRAQVRSNERIWSGFRQIELSIIGAHSLPELLTLLIDGVRRTFGGVEWASLACLDPDYSLSRLLASTGNAAAAVFVPVQPADLQRLFPNPPRPRLGRCDASTQALLFSDCPHRLGSMALVPLMLRGELVGCFNQASRHPTHYDPATATDFLEHLAAITALCIDNVINRERLKLDGLTDALTGIANRRFFERRLREELLRWRRRGGTLVCILVDVDHFKQVNDRYGHQAGDRVLAQVAGMLGKDLRASDVLARYGGEEFVLLLPETSERQGLRIAERLREVIERTRFELDTDTVPTVTVSVGLAVLDRRAPQDSYDAGEWLLHQADAALYRAKQAGRNQVALAT